MGIRWQWYAATLTCLIGAHRAAADVPWKTKTPYTTIAWVLPGGESPRGNPPKISDTNIVAGWLPSADKKQHLVVYAGGEIQTFSKFPKEDCKQVVVRPDGTVAWRDDLVPAEPLQVVDAVRGAS